MANWNLVMKEGEERSHPTRGNSLKFLLTFKEDRLFSSQLLEAMSFVYILLFT